MKHSGLFFKILIYASLVFLIYFLWRFDYLSLRFSELNYLWFFISIILLWAGFILSTISWRYALFYHKININIKNAIVSHGLSVFAKYIPGRVWVILGRASYIAQQGFSLKETSFVSLKEQLLYILLGLIISAVPSLMYFKFNYISISLLITCFVLSLILFNNRFHRLTEIVIKKIFSREIALPQMNIVTSGRLMVFIMFYWVTWTAAFYALSKAILPSTGIIYAFAFPLGVCYGILAILMPGGLGIREGLMVAFLVAAGVETESAVSLSIISRMWFITGEVFLFLVALILKRDVRKNQVEYAQSG